jgi:hypothetical protein
LGLSGSETSGSRQQPGVWPCKVPSETVASCDVRIARRRRTLTTPRSHAGMNPAGTGLCIPRTSSR